MVLERGAVIDRKLCLERPLAEGGMGSVWVARHLLLGTEVAIKFIRAARAESPVDRARFESEARIAATIKSPHVVQVLDYGVEGGAPYIVMELLDGEDLSAKLARERRLSKGAALSILTPLCKALRRAHSASLVHRDLKPSNIFLARSDDAVLVKVLDFGLVKDLNHHAPGVTDSNTLLGTPSYMSPEQVNQAKEVDHRSDLWAVGVILFQALTGRLPFEEDGLGKLLVAITAMPYPKPSSLSPELGPDVDRFFTRALARDPARRFPTADELNEAFAALCPEGASPLALPPRGAPRGAAREAATSLPRAPRGSLGSDAPARAVNTEVGESTEDASTSLSSPKASPSITTAPGVVTRTTLAADSVPPPTPNPPLVRPGSSGGAQTSNQSDHVVKQKQKVVFGAIVAALALATFAAGRYTQQPSAADAGDAGRAPAGQLLPTADHVEPPALVPDRAETKAPADALSERAEPLASADAGAEPAKAGRAPTLTKSPPTRAAASASAKAAPAAKAYPLGDPADTPPSREFE